MSKDEIIAKKESENEDLRQEIAVLKHELSQLRNLLFGSKKERFISSTEDNNQLNIFGTEEDTEEQIQEEQTISYTRKKVSKPHPGRHPIPDHFPCEEIIIEPEGLTEQMVKIGEQITETVDYTPASLVRKRIIRPKYADKQRDQVLIAPLPERPMPKCIADSGLITWIQVRKFVEHMPFYRQREQIKRDYDWQIPSSTLSNWFSQLSDLLRTLYGVLREEVIQSTYLQADESPIKVLESEKKGSTHQGYQWVYHNVEKKLVLFDYRKGRGRAGPKQILENYKGILQCDGWQVYDKITRTKPEIQLAGCMAHVRRKFYESRKTDQQKSDHVLKIIQKIYAHERQARDCEDRYIYRQEHSKPLLDRLYEWVEENKMEVLPKSPLGKAMVYLQKQKPKLEMIFKDGRIELDNNLIENKIRPLALGRKNYLFAGSHKSAENIAMMYSFFGSCKANEVNPYDWLKSTIEKINDTKLSDLHLLLPNKWA